jgi:hypothetical protein
MTKEIIQPPERRVLLDEFDLMSEADYALMIGTEIKTVRNTPRQDLPEFVKVGRQRFFKKESVRAFLEERRMSVS